MFVCVCVCVKKWVSPRKDEMGNICLGITFHAQMSCFMHCCALPKVKPKLIRWFSCICFYREVLRGFCPIFSLNLRVKIEAVCCVQVFTNEFSLQRQDIRFSHSAVMLAGPTLAG